MLLKMDALMIDLKAGVPLLNHICVDDDRIRRNRHAYRLLLVSIFRVFVPHGQLTLLKEQNTGCFLMAKDRMMLNRQTHFLRKRQSTTLFRVLQCFRQMLCPDRFGFIVHLPI